jgi:hypothetical protein
MSFDSMTIPMTMEKETVTISQTTGKALRRLGGVFSFGLDEPLFNTRSRVG